MNSGIQAAYSGLRAQTDALAMLANNLANLNTTGFKEDLAIFSRSNGSEDAGDGDQVNAASNQSIKAHGTINTAEGPLTMTSRNLDIAVIGSGFLKVQTPNGMRYTRNGNLQINADSVLTSSGHPVLGDGDKPITIRAGVVRIEEDGKIYVNNVSTDRLKIVTFEKLQGFEKEGNSLLALRNEKGTEIASEARVKSEHLELSNVNPVTSVIRMIEIMRNFESIQKSVNLVINEMNSKSIDKLGR